MTGYLKAALCVAVAVAACASQANAATYLQYDIFTQGGGSITNTRDFPLTVIPTYNLGFTFIVPLDGASGSVVTTAPDRTSISYATTGFFGFGLGGGSTTIDGNVLTLSQTQTLTSSGGGSVNVSACLPSTTSGVIPAFSFLPLANCGAVTFTSLGVSAVQEYSGYVTRITTTVLDQPAGIGLVSVTPGVPEPSTWALMLTGFGMAGYALRRRRAAVLAA